MARRKQLFAQLQRVALRQVFLPVQPAPVLRSRVRACVHVLQQGSVPGVPVLLQQAGERHRPVCGLAWLLALRRMGWEETECVLLEEDAAHWVEDLSLLESGSLQDPWRLAHALEQLQQRYGWTQAQLGQVIGRSRDFVANLLPINRISNAARTQIRSASAGRFTPRHLRQIGRQAPAQQMEWVLRILREGLSSKQLEREQAHSLEHSLEHTRRSTWVRPTRRSSPPRTLGEWRRYHRWLHNRLRWLETRAKKQEQQLEARMQRLRAERDTVRKTHQAWQREIAKELRRTERILLG